MDLFYLWLKYSSSVEKEYFKCLIKKTGVLADFVGYIDLKNSDNLEVLQHKYLTYALKFKNSTSRFMLFGKTGFLPLESSLLKAIMLCLFVPPPHPRHSEYDRGLRSEASRVR